MNAHTRLCVRMCMQIGTCARAVKGKWMEDLMGVLKFSCEFEGVRGVGDVQKLIN